MTNNIKEKVIKQFAHDRWRIDEGIVTLQEAKEDMKSEGYIDLIDLTIQECSKEKDKLIEEATEIWHSNNREAKSYQFGLKIANMKKSGE